MTSSIHRARSSLPLVLVGSLAMTCAVAPATASVFIVGSETDPAKTNYQAKRSLARATSMALATTAPATLTASATLTATPTAAADRADGESSPASANIREYIVSEGDTVSGIADRFGLSTSRILALNGLGWNSMIFPNQTLVLTGGSASTEQSQGSSNATDASSAAASSADASSAAASAALQGEHTVHTGDTMTAIAEKAGVSVQSLLAANGLNWSSIIYPGQKVRIPGVASGTSDNEISEAASEVAAPETSTQVASTEPVFMEITAETKANAETIIAVGRESGASDAGIIIALAAAMQESGLRNVAHGDRDSLGLFQQRPSTGWGTPDEVRDAWRASLAFYGGDLNPNPGVTRGLLDIRGWQDMSLTQAAQAVQISAHPNHYAKWEESARSWFDELG